MNRRDFTRKCMAGTVVMSALPYTGLSAAVKTGPSKITDPSKMKKGIMWGCIRGAEDVPGKFRLAKQAGFDGIEVMSHLDRGEVLQAQKETGLTISSVCDARHWKFMLSDPDPEVRVQGIEALKLALEDAAAYGTDTVLLVPGRVDATVAYDVCWDRTVEGIEEALPLAEKLKVNIAIENVWNNFLLSPLEAVRYVDQFDSPYVRFYFDCGNVLQCYGWPDQWIRILGRRITRIHIKDYSLSIARDQGIRPGYRVRLLEGEVDWSAVMKALKGIGYDGWATVETGLGGKDLGGLIDYRERLEKILSS